MKLKNLQMPKKIEMDEKSATDRFARFVIEPLERGFGATVGNALRRVLLSSLRGAAVSAVKIEGALHEFGSLPGIFEDSLQITQNLKQIRFKVHGEGPKRGALLRKGKGEVTAGDLKVDHEVEILNPDLHIATLNDEGEFTAEVEISVGRGYVQADQHQAGDRPIGTLSVDSLFSPVHRVNFTVEQTRIGQRIDYDKLNLEIWTDGSVSPRDALSHAAKILKDHFALFVGFEEEEPIAIEEEPDEGSVRIRKLLEKSVEELELSVRSSNCLRAANIKTLGELVTKTESEMLKYRNFGRKSLKEIQDVLSEMGLTFGMDPAALGLSPQPVNGDE
ncbi:MAG TPA: DNA-directed RNA polymerase subunit alpha [Candidatus Saccharimonadales bacterium]|nr:DNA-directed RNA polymerase subunit alpha [Candidatus Saccharimonadales bacterium]